MNAQRLTTLRRLMTELYNCGFAMADGDEEDVRPSELIETDIIMALSELESDNAALTKRVAELEAKQCAHEAELAVAHEFIADLQSQLAWTPVSKGLPTEPGVYEFLSHALNIHVFAWQDDRWVIAGLDEVHEAFELRARYSDYRRIELPKNGES